MRKSTALLAGMALSALVMIGLTVSAEQSSASFTATTTNPGNQFATASLTMSNDKTAAGSVVSLANMVPGDSASRTVVLDNTGGVGFTYTASIASNNATDTVLWTDLTNGLQVTVTRAGVAGNAYSGPLKNLAFTTPTASPIAAGALDTLTLVFSLPTSADNTFQNKTQNFTITYTATQLAGAAR